MIQSNNFTTFITILQLHTWLYSINYTTLITFLQLHYFNDRPTDVLVQYKVQQSRWSSPHWIRYTHCVFVICKPFTCKALLKTLRGWWTLSGFHCFISSFWMLQVNEGFYIPVFEQFIWCHKNVFPEPTYHIIEP